VPGGIAGSPRFWGSQIWRPGPPGWGLGVGLTAPPHKNPVVRKLKIGYGVQRAIMPKMMMMMIIAWYCDLYAAWWSHRMRVTEET
jgi:hypothetical protein